MQVFEGIGTAASSHSLYDLCAIDHLIYLDAKSLSSASNDGDGHLRGIQTRLKCMKLYQRFLHSLCVPTVGGDGQLKFPAVYVC